MVWVLAIGACINAVLAYTGHGVTGAVIGDSLIVVSVVLFSLKRVRAEQTPLVLYIIALILLWQSTMLGQALVGSDIHREYFMSQRALSQGWDLQYPYEQSNVSFVVGWLIPKLSAVSHIPILWFYKLVFPAVLALVAPILYAVYRRMINRSMAFYAVVFFLIVPVFSLEMSQIVKSMVAEVTFSLMLLVMVSKVKWAWKGLWIGVLLAATVLAHYTVGMVAMLFLAGIFAVRVVTTRLTFWQIWQKRRVPVAVMLVVIVAGVGVFYGYYSKVFDGELYRIVAANAKVFSSASVVSDVSPPVVAMSEPINVVPVSPRTDIVLPAQSYGNPSVSQTALGLDLNRASPQGKVFRFVQLLTEMAIVVGALWLLFRHKRWRFTSEWIAGSGASFVILGAAVFLPGFAETINMTRWYHMALFFLAPMFVLGVSLFSKRLVPVLLVVYFVFTSGMVYEITRSKVTTFIDVPYSTALGGERMGLVGVFNSDDVKAAEWLSQKTLPVVSSLNGFQLTSEYIDKVPRLKDELLMFRRTFENPQKHTYLFVTSWSTRNQMYVEDGSIGAGLRVLLPLPEFNYPVVFRSGDAVIYER